VESILAGKLDEILVGANTSGLESLRGDLLKLIGDEVDAQGELIDPRLLTTEVKDTDLCICKRPDACHMSKKQMFEF